MPPLNRRRLDCADECARYHFLYALHASRIVTRGFDDGLPCGDDDARAVVPRFGEINNSKRTSIMTLSMAHVISRRTGLIGLVIGIACASFAVSVFAQGPAPATRPATSPSRAPLNPNLPTLFVVGDSTASNGPRAGWGDPLADYFDLTKINVANRALGGRSSRSFITEGHWADALKEMKAGDYVLVQMGQNDGGGNLAALDTGRARGSLAGIGEETREITMPTTGPLEPPPPGTKEVVHTFGWYLRKYVNDTKAKGATPILMSLTGKDIWDNGKNRHPYDKYPEWTEAVAKAENVAYMDFNTIMGEQFDKWGQEKVHALFRDTTHTNEAGADVNAQGVIAGLKSMNSPLVSCLSEKGKAVEPYKPAAKPAQ
jgi:rhamnogalacturonan acetylesterase